jgi:hypothetical protein
VTPQAISSILSSNESLEEGDVALVTKAITSLIDNVDLNNETDRDMLLNSIDSVLSVDSDVLTKASQSTSTSATIVENFETIGARIPLPNGNRLSLRRSTYTLTVAEPSSDDVPPEGYMVEFDEQDAESFQLPKSLFTSGSTRVSASIIRTVGIFSGTDSTKVVASNVVSVTLNGRTVVGLQDKVIITIPKQRSTPAGMMDTCQFWNTTANGGIGEWSTSGCSLMGQSGSMVMCSCNHLTSFAVVQVPSSTSAPPAPVAPVNVAAIVVPIIIVLLLIAVVVIVVVAIVLVMSKRQRKSYDFKPANTDTVMENSPVTSTAMLDRTSPGAEEDGGDSKMTEKEIEGLETKATSNF